MDRDIAIAIVIILAFSIFSALIVADEFNNSHSISGNVVATIEVFYVIKHNEYIVTVETETRTISIEVSKQVYYAVSVGQRYTFSCSHTCSRYGVVERAE